MNFQPMASGAEAKIFRTNFLDHPAIVKIRSPKGYRHPELDHRIRSTRMRNEVKVMKEARSAGVRTPVVFDIDLKECSITMEYIEGKKIKDVLDDEDCDSYAVCRMIGKMVATLHNAGISHGDLTTSNMIMSTDGNIYVVDFSMGSFNTDLEEIGVDIRLLERAFASAHPDLPDQYAALIKEYCEIKTDSDKVMKKIQEIKDRGRYT